MTSSRLPSADYDSLEEAYAYLREGLTWEAARALARHLNQQPQSARGLGLYGTVLFLVNDLTVSEQLLRAASQIKCPQVDFLATLALVLHRQGRRDEAQELVGDIVAEAQPNVSHCRTLINAFHDLRCFARAKAARRRFF